MESTHVRTAGAMVSLWTLISIGGCSDVIVKNEIYIDAGPYPDGDHDASVATVQPTDSGSDLGRDTGIGGSTEPSTGRATGGGEISDTESDTIDSFDAGQQGGFCGDGKLDPHREECDNGLGPSGAPESGDGCDRFCRIEECGNGRVEDNEECDDTLLLFGEPQNGDGCDRQCRIEFCGNRRRESNEECDDGVGQSGLPESGDGCDRFCRIEECGNNRIEDNEECDDNLLLFGAPLSGDGCDRFCRIEECGNGRVEDNEDCDPGEDSDESCVECRWATTCIDCAELLCSDYAGVNAFDECYDAPVEEGNRCATLVGCAREHCGGETLAACYCGDRSVQDCVLSGPLNGQCVQETRAAAGAADSVIVGALIEGGANGTTPVHDAARIINCHREHCPMCTSTGASDTDTDTSGNLNTDTGTDTSSDTATGSGTEDNVTDSETVTVLGCSSCLESNCRDDSGEDLLAACYEDPANGDLCAALVACAYENRCVIEDAEGNPWSSPHPNHCYCGTVSNSHCMAGLANGPCKAEYEAAAGTSEPMELGALFFNAAYPIGNASKLLVCAGASCTSCVDGSSPYVHVFQDTGAQTESDSETQTESETNYGTDSMSDTDTGIGTATDSGAVEGGNCDLCVLDNCLSFKGIDAWTGCNEGANAPLCQAVVQCAHETHCVVEDPTGNPWPSPHPNKCYCGTASQSQCMGGQANGECKAEVEAAAGSTDAMIIGDRFGDTTYPIGNANNLLICERDECGSCLDGTWSDGDADTDFETTMETSSLIDTDSELETSSASATETGTETEIGTNTKGGDDPEDHSNCPVCDSQYCADDEGDNWTSACFEGATATACETFMICAHNTGCMMEDLDGNPWDQPHPNKCYCGNVSNTQCMVGMANGECKVEAEAAAETTDPFTVGERFTNPNYALGDAYNLLLCERRNCPDCYSDSGETGGGTETGAQTDTETETAPSSETATASASETAEGTVACQDPSCPVTYVIGGSEPDFVSVEEAVASLSGGVTSCITFCVADGSYNEQITIPSIVGASRENAITFRSMTGHRDQVVLRYGASTANDNHIVRLENASHIRFRNMTLESFGSTFGAALVVEGGASYNLFENMEFRTIAGAEATLVSIIDYSQGNQFHGCRFGGGANGLQAYSSGMSMRGLEIRNSIFEDQSKRGIELQKQYGAIVQDNEIVSDSTDNDYTAVRLLNCYQGWQVNDNRIRTLTGRGIWVGYCPGTETNPNRISNNFVYLEGLDEATQTIALELDNTTFTRLVYNTLVVGEGAGDHSVTLYVPDAAGSVSGEVYARNNIFSNFSDGVAVELQLMVQEEGEVNVLDSDYSDWFSAGLLLGRFGLPGALADAADLGAWQTGVGMDLHSVYADPLFVTQGDHPVCEVSLDGSGLPLEEDSDIDGDERDSLTPDIGADEFDSASCL